MNRLRIATRESALALWQAEHVASLLRAAHPGLEVLLVPMTTSGDQVLDRTLAEVGGKGLFIKELEVAMLEGRADIAVHSMKDVPAELPQGMTLAAMLPRADARDAFVSNRFARCDDLPQGARVGTASLRRQSQLLARRPDLVITPLRGNVQTRLRKLDEGQFDAIVLASAGLTRLGLASRISEYIDVDASVPAVGQGVIGIECRSGDARSLVLCAALDDAQAAACVRAERAFARRLEGNCQSPIAAHAQMQGEHLELIGLVAAADGSAVLREQGRDDHAAGEALGQTLAEKLLARGAARLLGTH